MWRKFYTKRKGQAEVRKQAFSDGYQAYYVPSGKAVWSPREYGKFAEEAYARNVVAHQCVSMIARAVAGVGWWLHRVSGGKKARIEGHPLVALFSRPSPLLSGPELIEALVGFRLIAGNAFLLAVGPKDGRPVELHLLRPDRVRVIPGKGGMPAGYQHQVGSSEREVVHYPVDRITGKSRVLHLKTFHPLNDWYGLSPVEAAAYAIDQHNQAGEWNQALLQNGARPSGALIVKGKADGSGGTLSDEQYLRLKHQIEDQYSGAGNAGRPILLEGGLEWREMSLSPKDMDFLEAKHAAAREIALAFGVPPQLLGIPGDNTYSNLAEARLALWEQTVLPMLDHLATAFNHWLAPMFGEGLEMAYDAEGISALSVRRDALWARVKGADFLTDDEKRAMLGLGAKG